MHEIRTISVSNQRRHSKSAEQREIQRIKTEALTRMNIETQDKSKPR